MPKSKAKPLHISMKRLEEIMFKQNATPIEIATMAGELLVERHDERGDIMCEGCNKWIRAGHAVRTLDDVFLHRRCAKGLRVIC